MEEVFEGLSDDQKLIYEDLKGPSWSRDKINRKKLVENISTKIEKSSENLDLESTKQSTKDYSSNNVNQGI